MASMYRLASTEGREATEAQEAVVPMETGEAMEDRDARDAHAGGGQPQGRQRQDHGRFNIAAALAAQGLRVLVVDLDAQATATRWLGFEPLTGQGLSRVLGTGTGVEGLVVPTDEPGLELVPGDDWLAITERRDFDGAAVPQLAVRQALTAAPLPHDLVFLDTPGRLSLLTVAALAAADEALAPVPAAAMELEHLDDLQATVGEVAALKPQLGPAWLAPWAVDARTVLARDVQQRLHAHHGEQLLAVTVRRTVRAQEAFAHRQPLTRFAPQHPVTADMARLARALMEGAVHGQPVTRAAP